MGDTARIRVVTARGPPLEVRLVVEVEGHDLVVCFKTREALDGLVASLYLHAAEAWPKPNAPGVIKSDFEI
jgi:hypothetical protein